MGARTVSGSVGDVLDKGAGSVSGSVGDVLDKGAGSVSLKQISGFAACCLMEIAPSKRLLQPEV